MAAWRQQGEEDEVNKLIAERMATRSPSHPITERESGAGAAHPWGTEDVADWLDQIGMARHVSLFRYHGINGQQLLRSTSPGLAELGIEDANERQQLLREIGELEVSKTEPEEVRKTFKLERRDNQDFALVDVETNESIALTTYFREQGLLPKASEPFTWSPSSGWVRNLPAGESKACLDWTTEDLCVWFGYFGLEACIPLVQDIPFTGETFANASVSDLMALAATQGLEAAMQDALSMFHHKAQHTFPVSQRGEPSVGAGAAGLGFEAEPYVPVPASNALLTDQAWYGGLIPAGPVLARVKDAPEGTFFLFFDESDGEIPTVIYKDADQVINQELIDFDERRGWSLKESQVYFDNLFQLVHYYASATNPLRKWELPYPDADLEHYEWYLGAVGLRQAKMELNEGKPFVVRQTAEDQFSLHFLSRSQEIEEKIDSQSGLFRLKKRPLYQFPSLVALIADIVYVNNSERGFVLDAYQEYFHFTMDPAQRYPWYIGPCPAEEAVTILATQSAPAGSFVVREDLDNPDLWWLDVVCQDQKNAAAYRIIKNESGYVQLEDSTNDHTNIAQLVRFYSEPQDEFPLTLDPSALELGPGDFEDEANGGGEEEEEEDAGTVPRSSDLALPEVSRVPSWLFLEVKKHHVLRMLTGQPEGTFAVRASESHSDCYALSCVSRGVIFNNLIQVTNQPDGEPVLYMPSARGASSPCFANLEELVAYYQVPRKGFMCTLRSDDFQLVLPRNAEPALAQAPWHRPDLSQEDAIAGLAEQPNGAFVVLDVPNGHLLLYKRNGGFGQELIIDSYPQGLFLKRVPNKMFKDLEYLVKHFQGKSQLDLPVRLLRPAKKQKRTARGHHTAQGHRSRKGGQNGARPRRRRRRPRAEWDMFGRGVGANTQSPPGGTVPDALTERSQHNVAKQIREAEHDGGCMPPAEPPVAPGEGVPPPLPKRNHGRRGAGGAGGAGASRSRGTHMGKELPWLRMDVDEESAKEHLKDQVDGHFLVHSIQGAWGALTIAYRRSYRVYFIEQNPDGSLQLRGNTTQEAVGNIQQLVTFYRQHMTDDLPCKLVTYKGE